MFAETQHSIPYGWEQFRPVIHEPSWVERYIGKFPLFVHHFGFSAYYPDADCPVRPEEYEQYVVNVRQKVYEAQRDRTTVFTTPTRYIKQTFELLGFYPARSIVLPTHDTYATICDCDLLTLHAALRYDFLGIIAGDIERAEMIGEIGDVGYCLEELERTFQEWDVTVTRDEACIYYCGRPYIKPFI